ncbi:MAG: YbjN domain-containing protein [Cyanobacteria bacterium P01_A01_bin.135]
MTYNTDTTLDADTALDEASENLVETIETIISSLEQDDSAMVRRVDGGHLWTFKYGSVDVFVQLTGTTDDDTFKAWAKVLSLPVQEQPRLMQKLLEMNWSGTFEACFCILSDEQGEQVAVSTTRTVAELSPSEISRNITIVATIADEQDDALAAEFSA